MHGVTTQQTSTLCKIVFGTLTHNNGAQPQTITYTRFFDQNTRQQTTNPAETVKHDITTLATLAGMTDNTAQLGTQEGIQILTTTLAELVYQARQVN